MAAKSGGYICMSNSKDCKCKADNTCAKSGKKRT